MTFYPLSKCNQKWFSTLRTSAWPEVAPSTNDNCDDAVTCSYGEECCCGECHPSLLATCSDGRWTLVFTDACEAADILCPGKFYEYIYRRLCWFYMLIEILAEETDLIKLLH